MREIYSRSLSECGYNASYFIQMVNDRGALPAAKYLLSVNAPQSGFTRLWELGRLDLTVEALATSDKFISLFDEDEIRAARQKLKEMGYQF